MSLTVLWCDDWVRLDPFEGAAIDGDNQAPEAPPVRLLTGRNMAASFQLLVGPLKRNTAVTVSPGKLSGPGHPQIPYILAGHKGPVAVLASRLAPPLNIQPPYLMLGLGKP